MSEASPERLQESAAPIPKGKDTYRRLLGYVAPYKARFALAIVCMMFAAMTEVAFAWLMKPLLDGSFVNQDKTAIVLVPVAIIVIFVVRGISAFGSRCLHTTTMLPPAAR